MKLREIKEMITFYDDKKILLHIKLKTGKFYNGYFVEWETSKVLVFDDRVIGLIHIFLDQIENIEEFKKNFKEVKNLWKK